MSSWVRSTRRVSTGGRIPGTIGMVTPAARASSTKRVNSAACQENWEMAKSAPATCLWTRRSTSVSGLVPAAGLPAGKVATAMRIGWSALCRASGAERALRL